jgi:hypothetical protein
VIPARCTGPRAALTHAMEGAFNTTRTAYMTLTEANLEDVLKASLIIGEALKEIADAKVGGC